ncbi:tetratricopeptide repeat protein [Microbulbifer rhizosphaerae]|uniref:TPR repeat protein n=1 Tax=Microbulbifer rhizosphaerae TaxID=1562603 RepID=A0A7W4WAH8_9GAMM|nr:sel1 repeat family protein [Microbulbifer rhizosphaerae]MBB3060663.1 TPR repeat protein [Microbulbifer rhizosphaerae]
MRKWRFLLPLVAATSGCATAPETIDLPVIAPAEMAFEETDLRAVDLAAPAADSAIEAFADADTRLAFLAARILEDVDAVPFEEFWSAYLDSSKVHTAVVDREQFQQAVEKLSDGEGADCAAVDWDKWTEQNFFELEPHLAAQDCYEQLGDTDKAERHARAVQFILRGVLGGGDGKNHDSAYEIGILDHAEDVLDLAGYQLLDAFLLPFSRGRALYYVVLAEDPDSGEQRHIYFDNQQAIHRLLGDSFPFGSLDGLYIGQVLQPLSAQSTAAKIGMGLYLESIGKGEEAAEYYLDATALGSQVAQFRLGKACLEEKVPMFSPEDCVDFLLSAAEQGYANAMVTLAHVYREGLGVEPSEELFQQFMEAAQRRLEPGLGWYRLASYYGGRKRAVEPQTERKFLRRAAADGLQDAQYRLIRREQGEWSEVEAAQLLPQLAGLARRGHRASGLAYAHRVFASASERTPEELAAAREFLDAALAVNSRAAHSLQGRLLASGLLGQRDFAMAERHFLRSAQLTASQVGLARLHQQQRLSESSPEMAAAWYMMCADTEASECLYQLGKIFRSGEGIERDAALGRTLILQAAEQGHKRAMLEVGKWEGD